MDPVEAAAGMEVDPAPVLPSLNFLNTANLKRQRSASAEENEKKRMFTGRAYDDIIEAMFWRFRLAMVACVKGKPIVYEFQYRGKNRNKEDDDIKLFFQLRIVDADYGRKTSLTFFIDDKYGTVHTLPRFQELGLSATETLKCGLTESDVRNAFTSHESALWKAVVGWLNYAEAFFV